MKSELEKFYAAVEEIDTAMMTTRRPDGHLRSRAMANQKPADGADLWFVTADGSDKLDDLGLRSARQPFLLQEQQQGMGVGVRHRRHRRATAQKIRELYAPDWSIWFPNEGDPRHGTAGRPAIRPHRRDGPRGRLPRGEQAEPGAAFRDGQGLADRDRAEARRDARGEGAATAGASV